MISVQKVPVATSLLVRQLADDITEESLILHFENKSVGGGNVTHVEIITTEQSAVITFENSACKYFHLLFTVFTFQCLHEYTSNLNIILSRLFN